MDFKKITDDEIDNYLGSIIDGSGRNVLISPLRVAYDKFIQPGTPCMASVAQAHAFVVDCVDDYKKFLQYYRDSQAGGLLLQQIQAVDIFINNFFGAGGNEVIRRTINGLNPDLHSIKKYKGKNCAMCFERAILSHNLLKLLGRESFLITKKLHTYVIIKNNNFIYIYDPMNPTFAEVKGKMLRFPSIRTINCKKAESFLYGKQSLNIEPSYYEFMFGATNIKTPKIEYVGLELDKPLWLDDDIEDSL